MTTKLNRAKQALRSWASEHKKLRSHVRQVRKFWKLYNQSRIDGDEFACLVATEFQFNLDGCGPQNESPSTKEKA